MSMDSCRNLCKKCAKKLTSDEKAIYLKLVDRTASRFLCLDCLGEKMGWGGGGSLLKKESVIIGKAAIVYYSVKKGVSPLHTNQEEKLLFYFVKS